MREKKPCTRDIFERELFFMIILDLNQLGNRIERWVECLFKTSNLDKTVYLNYHYETVDYQVD